MSTLPFDIIALIIDTVEEKKDTNLLKKLALVSHCFHQICSKHLFATVELHDADSDSSLASSKKGFVKLLRSRPDIVNYIRKLTYTMNINNEDDLLSPILPNFLRTISCLKYLKISASWMDWNKLRSSLTSALLHLMHLPTINHIDLSFIQNFPLSSLTPCVDLHRLNISDLKCTDLLEGEIVVQSEMMPKIREFNTYDSSLVTTMLLHAKRQDERPAFNFKDLRRLSTCLEDKQNIRYLVQNAKLLEKLHLTVGYDQNLVGLHDILSPSAHTLKVLDLRGFFCMDYISQAGIPLFVGLCEELEAVAEHNRLEALSFEVYVDRIEAVDFIGSLIQNVEKELVKPGWSALRQVSFEVPIVGYVVEESAELSEMLQSLPDKYLSHFPKLESIAFSYSVYVT